MTNPSDDAIDRLRADRERGASALAKDAVKILAATAADRQALDERLAAMRPSMPAIAAIAGIDGRMAARRSSSAWRSAAVAARILTASLARALAPRSRSARRRSMASSEGLVMSADGRTRRLAG